VNDEIRVLGVEVDALSKALDTISESFKDPSLAELAIESQTGYDAQHWQNVRRSLGDCKATLASLETVVEKLKTTGGGLLRRSIGSRLKLDINSGAIALLKQQITAYRRTMQLSLQLITVYVPPPIS
jgi:hypothetical protein